MPKNDPTSIKIVVLGMHGVGKSALTVRFMTRRFITEYADGQDSSYSHSMTVKGKTYDVVLIDHGSNQVDAKELICWADGVILVYSIEDTKSFEEAQRLLAEVKPSTGRRRAAAVVLVGNKKDLNDKRQIPTTEAKNVAKEARCPLYEVSAAQDIEVVAEIFTSCVYRIIDSRRLDANGHDHASRTPDGVRKMFNKIRRRTDTV